MATSSRTWLLIFPVVAVLGGGAYYAYRKVLPSPQAHLHVPGNTAIALRIDAVKLFEFEPLKKLAEKKPEDGAGGASKAERERLAKYEEHTGIAPGSLREVIVASADATAWVALVAGTFPSDRFVSGTAAFIKEQYPKVTFEQKEDRLRLYGGKVVLAQAEDGTLIIGTHDTVVDAALPLADEAPEGLPLLTGHAIAFAAKRSAMDGAAMQLPLNAPGFDVLNQATGLKGWFALTKKPELTISLALSEGTDPQKAAKEVESLLGKAKIAALVPLLPDPVGAIDAFSKATVKVVDGDVTVTAPWSYDKLAAVLNDLGSLKKLAQ